MTILDRIFGAAPPSSPNYGAGNVGVRGLGGSNYSTRADGPPAPIATVAAIISIISQTCGQLPRPRGAGYGRGPNAGYRQTFPSPDRPAEQIRRTFRQYILGVRIRVRRRLGKLLHLAGPGQRLGRLGKWRGRYPLPHASKNRAIQGR